MSTTGGDATIRPRGPKRQLSLPYVPKFSEAEDDAGALTPRAPTVYRSSSCNTHRVHTSTVTPGAVTAASLLKTPTMGFSSSAPIPIPGRQVAVGSSPPSGPGGLPPPVPHRRYTDPDELELLALSDAHLSTSRSKSNRKAETVSSSTSPGSRRSSKRTSVPVPKKGVRALLGWPEARALEVAAGSGAVEIWYEYESACEAMLCAFERLDMPAVLAALEEYWRNLGHSVQWKLNMTPDLKEAYSRAFQLLLESFLRELDSHISDPPVESLCNALVTLGNRFDVVLGECMLPLRLAPEFSNDLIRLGARFGQYVVSIVGIWEQIAELRGLSSLRSTAWLSKQQVSPDAVCSDAPPTITALSPRPRVHRRAPSPPRMETIKEPRPEGLKIITTSNGIYLPHLLLSDNPDGEQDGQDLVVASDPILSGVVSSPQSAWSVDTKVEDYDDDDVLSDVDPLSKAASEGDAIVLTQGVMGTALLDDFMGFESSQTNDEPMRRSSRPTLKSQRSAPLLASPQDEAETGVHMERRRSNGLSRSAHVRTSAIRCG